MLMRYFYQIEKEVDQVYLRLAVYVAGDPSLEEGPERTVALRKLLESRDAARRVAPSRNPIPTGSPISDDDSVQPGPTVAGQIGVGAVGLNGAELSARSTARQVDGEPMPAERIHFPIHDDRRCDYQEAGMITYSDDEVTCPGCLAADEAVNPSPAESPPPE